MSADPVLKVEDLVVSYGQANALREINVRIDDHEIVGVIGPNGAGKTTLSETIAGFKEYESGQVRYRGEEIAEKTPGELTEEGLIYATERRDLFDFMTVEENLELGAYRNREHVDSQLSFVYELFPRLQERRRQLARTLSGGEQQMLALGRGLMGAPDFLVLDEPTIGLAPVIIDDISEGIQTIHQKENITVLLCEQNVTFAMRHADRIYLLENGEIHREGPPEELRQDEYVKEAYIGR